MVRGGVGEEASATIERGGALGGWTWSRDTMGGVWGLPRLEDWKLGREHGKLILTMFCSCPLS